MATLEQAKTRVSSAPGVKGGPNSNGDLTNGRRFGLQALALCVAALAASCCGEDEKECTDEKRAEAGAADAGSPDSSAQVDAGTPDAEVPVCETEERAPAEAPEVTVGRYQKLDATLLRVFFTVGEFDRECAGPVKVRCRAKIQRPDNSNDPWARPETTEDFLEGVAIIDKAGEVHWDFGMKPDEHVTSFQLVTTDIAGNEDFSDPVVCDAC